MKEDLEGTVKVYSVSRCNDRAYHVMKNDIYPDNQFFSKHFYEYAFVQHELLKYCLDLWLIQQENLSNF
jgi:hypothetical protein